MSPYIQRTMVAVTTAALALSCAGGQTTTLEPSSTTPAARGNVEAKRSDDGNTRLSVEVRHLAPAHQVATGTSTYVVWARPYAATGDASPRNLGALAVDQNLKGELETLTPLQSFELMVTPEASAKVQRPSNDPVLTAKVSAR